MTDPVVLYKPADLKDPALLREAERLGCKPEDLGWVPQWHISDPEIKGMDLSMDGPEMRVVVQIEAGNVAESKFYFRVYRSCDGQMWVKSGEVRPVKPLEYFLWGRNTISQSATGSASSHSILIPARWADEGEP